MKNLVLLPLFVACCAVPARADLSYTQTTSSPFGAMMGNSSGIVSKVYSKGTFNRTEAQMFGRKMITIARGAKSVIQIDPATKTYTVGSASSAALAKTRMPSGAKMPSMSMTVSTKKLGVQNLRGIKAPHYLVNMDMKMSTPRGPQNMKMGMEVWGSNVSYPISAKTRGDALQSLPANIKGMFGGALNIKGDLKGMGAAFGTVPLRMKILMNGQPISTTETTNISTKALPASLFAVPAGYRAVSNQQYAKTLQASMRQSMATMMKNRPKR
ncbi:hypothetical protein B1R32_10431 [Abditibacterium utsteinense]|uniref:DUF4412 domain-containing protein n=1 Tax=Abditibacterium utsteinense TaxID=1960156 RepID=A0A2S8SUR3_9BACT|nr:hypothetical protein [Abditibacterium utsteinense]PQV64538.1 hypothetical protein B1R32_10431 [Abditibacterium utsteinense]